MTSNLLFAVGTLFSWLGWALTLRTIFVLAQWVTKVQGFDLSSAKRGLITAPAGAAACFIVSAILPMTPDPNVAPSAIRFPLVWLVMPWMAWIGFAALGLTLLRGLQSLMSGSLDERNARLKSAGFGLITALIALGLYKYDSGNHIEILKGGIQLTLSSAAGALLLLVAATFAMVAAGRSVTTRGYSKVFASQLALLVGSFVFGLPFAFLIITSFKEDRDMSSPNGIVWVPHVQDTVPYFDKNDPLYTAQYEGQTIEGSVIEHLADGQVKVDIQKPMAIRGATFVTTLSALKEIPKQAKLYVGSYKGAAFQGMEVAQTDEGLKTIEFITPVNLKGQRADFDGDKIEPVRHLGLRTANYPDALDFLPPETNHGLVYLKNTLLIVVLSVIGTILSSAIVAYAFSRMIFPGRDILFGILLSTMMLPGAVTLMPQFLIFRQLGWIDTLYPLWVPAFFGSAFNIFLLRQFFMQIPMELEDAAKIDGCTYLKTFWDVMMPQIKPSLAAIAIWTFMGSWNNFMGPLIYINSPENMPLSYALTLFNGDRTGEPGLLMAFATLSMLPVLAVFFFGQRYIVEGVTLSGLGGR